MDIRYVASPEETQNFDADQLRKHYLVGNLFADDELTLTYSHHDRVIVGSAVPKTQDLVLGVQPELRTDFFLQRREIGIINIGDAGVITVGDESYTLQNCDCLYVGMGVPEIIFQTGSGRFYLVSAPAHQTYPTQHVSLEHSYSERLGGTEHSNERTLHRFIHSDGIQSCQLMLGLTELVPGNIWNTMPPHVHDRRMEVYLYFGLSKNDRVFHMMGKPDETRHILVSNEQAVISPSWSIHAGAGTSNYSFIWAMAGENYTFTDMDLVAISDIK